MNLPFSASNGATVFVTALTTIILYIAVKFIALPLWEMSAYKKQGVPCYFFPLLGATWRGREYAKRFGDGMAFSRQLALRDQHFQAEIVNSGSSLHAILYDPKMIKEFFANQACYKKIQFTKDLNLLIKTGLVLAEGDTWKSHRRIISSIFHFDFIKQNIPLIVSTTQEFLQELATTSLKNVNIMDEIQKITGEIVGRIFFGENLSRYTCRGQILTLYLAELSARCSFFEKGFLAMTLHLMGINYDWIPRIRDIMNEIKEFRLLCLKIVQDRKKSGDTTHDMLGLLIKTQSSPNPEDRFSDDDIVNEFITFFIAGMDTTGHVITMALYLLDKNPQYKDTLMEEIKNIYNKTDPITIDEINQMEMTHAVIKEAIRLYTPVPSFFPRRVIADHNLLNIPIKKGMIVSPRVFYNFSNPRHFEDATSFKPERWLTNKQQTLEGFVDIPFSAGGRNCIGQHLAMLEAKIIIAEFTKLFDFKVAPEDFKLVMGFGMLYEPKNKICMDLNLKQINIPSKLN